MISADTNKSDTNESDTNKPKVKGLDGEWLEKKGYKLLKGSSSGVEYKHDILTVKDFEKEDITMYHWLKANDGKAVMVVYLEYKERRVKLAIEKGELNSKSLDQFQTNVNKNAKEVLNKFVAKL